MARGQLVVLRALIRKKLSSRLLSSGKPVFIGEVYFSGLNFLESATCGSTLGKIPSNFFQHGYIHLLSLNSRNVVPALDAVCNRKLKILSEGKCFSVLSKHSGTNAENFGTGEMSEKEKMAGVKSAEKTYFEKARNVDISENAVRTDNTGNVEDVRSRDPAVLFQEISKSRQKLGQSKTERQKLMKIFHWFTQTGWARDQALALYINASFFPTAARRFRIFFLNKCPRDVVEYLVGLGPCKESDRFLFPVFAEFCLRKCQDEIKIFRNLVHSADLTKPHTWFPFARAMRRKIIYHCGPTNSGKTYNALQRFMEAESGVYCGPLRLLAMEVFDKVNARGVYCSLHTGQEKKNVPFAKHVACTVEMASTEECYEVAVVDEIQMIGDDVRGFAWSRALLGLKADEIHLCGDPSVLSLVRNICAATGDDLTEYHYDRFKNLVVEAKSILGNFQNIQPGDCVVAFSRREIFEVKMAIERFTKHRCCVIYGALPPETRKQQANLFNNPDNEYDVLVASDAVGMGLNLNIRRVVFYGLQKYNGDKMQPVPASQIKQIAGRAGRRGSIFPEGLTTTYQLEDVDYLIECLQKPFVECKSAGLFPYFEQVELFASQLPDVSFCQLLERFAENCRLDGSYFLCRHDHIKKVAHMLDKVQGLSLEDRYNFCFAPVNTRDPKAMNSLLRFASEYSKNLPVRIAMGMPRGSAKNDMELLDLETKHQVLSMYLWLSHHFKEETFPYKERAERMAIDIADLLAQSLAKARWKPESRGRNQRKSPPKDAALEREVAREIAIIKKRQLTDMEWQKLHLVTT
eukprot:Gb_39537 [translate_table: standard]